MKSYILKRGNIYNFVRRIPIDLQEHFPTKTLYRTLRTGDIREARLLAASYEYETERVFMRLRTGMLETFEACIMVERLTTGINKIESTAYGKKFSPFVEQVEQMSIDDLMQEHGCDEATAKELQAKIYAAFSTAFGKSLARQDTTIHMPEVERVDATLRKQYKVMLNSDEKRVLALKFLNMDRELALAESEVRSGNYDRLQLLMDRKDRQAKEASTRYFLRDIVKAYFATYDTAEKKDITLNSWRAVKRQTDFIFKELGNIEFLELNSKAASDKLKVALSKRKKSTGEPLSAKECSSYFERLKSIVTFAIEKYEIDSVNKIKVTRGKGGGRSSYSGRDIKQLEEALCTAPMKFGKAAQDRYDRFWIIIIAILHGFRLTSIVELRRRHLVKDEQTGLLCFDLTVDKALLKTKSDNMRALVPIHPMLHELGFLVWLDKRNLHGESKLFEDFASGFGQWFNGLTKTSGWNYDYITHEDKKTFHSFRHYFCCCMDELAVSEKQKDEMSGHAGSHKGKGVRQKFYLERIRVKSMADTFQKSIEQGRILMEDLNWQRLKLRALELFDI
jgi:integrase